MIKSTPDDLAVTFRSLTRRQEEAIGEADITDEVEQAIAELRRLVADAAGLLRVPADAIAVADELDARPAHAWSTETLDALRQVALDVGRTLRRLASIAQTDDADD